MRFPSFWISLLLLILGFLVYWPLGVVAIFLAALYHHFIPAIIYGAFMDILYGPPPVFLHFLHIPFTLLTVVFVVVILFAERILRRRKSAATL
ncbi:MAG: hypothetical protein KGJ34_02305 [Patescibacteria group bacterium]|nr:hypothetical protein [Patescibacteria group bacterium]